jgi:hypothetical protein
MSDARLESLDSQDLKVTQGHLNVSFCEGSIGFNHLDRQNTPVSRSNSSSSCGSNAPSKPPTTKRLGTVMSIGSSSSVSDDEAHDLTLFRTCTKVQDNANVVAELEAVVQEYNVIDLNLKDALLGRSLPEDHLLGNVDHIVQLIKDEWVDEGMAIVTNNIFLSLVRHNYWNLINEGDLRPGSTESDVLFTSIHVGVSPYSADLEDYAYLQKTLSTGHEFADRHSTGGTDQDFGHLLSDGAEMMVAEEDEQGTVAVIVASWQFHAAVAVALCLNALQVIAEEIWRQPDQDIYDHPMWLALDAVFTFLFLVECVLKLSAMKMKYFNSGWNRFDIFLVGVGLIGVIMSSITHGKEADMAGKTRIIRVGRVLRTLRFLRIFRLFHARMSADKYVSMELARHMKTVVTLGCFIRAHCAAQIELVKYFGGNGEIDAVSECELGRCILQSQVTVYKALCEAARTQAHLDKDIFTELKNLHRRKQISENLTKFVIAAHGDGAISSTEAHAILHPLYHNIAECVQKLAERSEGVIDCGGDLPHNGTGKSSTFANLRKSISVATSAISRRNMTTSVSDTSSEGERPTSIDAKSSDEDEDEDGIVCITASVKSEGAGEATPEEGEKRDYADVQPFLPQRPPLLPAQVESPSIDDVPEIPA